MDINLLSSISCDKRNNYESDFCSNLNPDKINNFLKPYYIDPFGIKNKDNNFFSKNEFSLENEDKTINNYNKEYCASYTIDNNYKGFTYKGDKNKCLLFDSQKFDKKINNDFLNNYNVKTFLKIKNIIDIKNIDDQHKYENYFVENNNLDFMPENIIDESIVENKDDCMKSCITNFNKCKSIMYLEEPKKCSFYNKKVMKNNNMLDSDTYTVRNKKLESNNSIINSIIKNYDKNDNKYNYCKINNDKCILDYSVDNLNNEDLEIPTRSEITNVPIYNCGGLKSTNPFCTKEYNPDDYIDENENLVNYTDCIDISNFNTLSEKKKFLNNICKEKYGLEYEYDDNIYDTKSLINCGDSSKSNNTNKMAKCKIHLFNKNVPFITDDKIEHFSNYNAKYNIYIFLYVCLLICLLIFFLRLIL
jgi:hypothetical protein